MSQGYGCKTYKHLNSCFCEFEKFHSKKTLSKYLCLSQLSDCCVTPHTTFVFHTFVLDDGHGLQGHSNKAETFGSALV